MSALLVAFGVVGLLLIATGSRFGRKVFWVGALAPAATIAWVVFRLSDVIGGQIPTQRVAWVPGLDLFIDLRLDGFATTMTLIIAVVGVLVFAYAASYFPSETPDLGRLAGLLVLFAGAMVGLVLADQLLILYAFWEITSITSYLLIGNTFTDAKARAAALHALLVTVTGGLAMLGGFVILGQAAGTYRLSALVAGPAPTGTAVTVALVLVLIGAFTKSAQYPFHAWLPGAMVAPTPVSAYLHSATMVTAGVYLVARLTPAFGSSSPWQPLVLTVGTFTLLAGGLRAIRQHDLKLLLAYGTVSQLGLMMVLFGAGTAAAATAGWVLLIAHAGFKAALFMVVGILDRETGTRDIDELPSLGRGWWWVEGVALISVISMAGVPLGIGFVAKESAYDALLHAPFSASGFVLGAVVIGSMFTVAYSARFYLGAFVGPRRRARAGGEARSGAVPRPAWRFVAPAALLAAVGIVLGVAPGLEDELASAAIPGYPSLSVHLTLWHGWSVPLALSAITLGGGALLVAADRRTQQVLALGRTIPSAQRFHLEMLSGLVRSSRRVTGAVQSGSLPVYAGIILATAAILPITVLATSWSWTGWPTGIGPVADVPIATLLIVAAIGAATIRRRFSAAMLLGAAGYAMAGLFVAYGAPDLALTAGPVRAAVEPAPTYPPHRDRGRRRRNGVRVRDRCGGGRQPRPTGPRGRESRRTRRWRTQRRQRNARRLPRFRHARRHHRAPRRVGRRGRPRTRRSSRRTSAGRAHPPGETGREADRVRRRLGSARLPCGPDALALVALRRAQPTGRRLRRRPAGRVRDRAALHRRGNGRGALVVQVPAVDRPGCRSARRRGHGRAATPDRELRARRDDDLPTPAARRNGEDQLGTRLRRRRVHHRHRHGAHGVRGIRRRTDAGAVMTILLAFTAAALFSIGTYLVLQRKLSRIIIGLALLTHGGNILLITSGRRGNPPIVGSAARSTFSDPVPQALALTAIVITFAVTALLLALAYRSWLLTHDDEVEDDVGDRDIARDPHIDKNVADQQMAITETDAEGASE